MKRLGGEMASKPAVSGRAHPGQWNVSSGIAIMIQVEIEDTARPERPMMEERLEQ
jgi:hypothetical protein